MYVWPARLSLFDSPAQPVVLLQCHHFALLTMGKVFNASKRDRTSSSPDDGEGGHSMENDPANHRPQW